MGLSVASPAASRLVSPAPTTAPPSSNGGSSAPTPRSSNVSAEDDQQNAARRAMGLLSSNARVSAAPVEDVRPVRTSTDAAKVYSHGGSVVLKSSPRPAPSKPAAESPEEQKKDAQVTAWRTPASLAVSPYRTPSKQSTLSASDKRQSSVSPRFPPAVTPRKDRAQLRDEANSFVKTLSTTAKGGPMTAQSARLGWYAQQMQH